MSRSDVALSATRFPARLVIPAQAGIKSLGKALLDARFAGMTGDDVG
jgi:hypothetical protein